MVATQQPSTGTVLHRTMTLTGHCFQLRHHHPTAAPNGQLTWLPSSPPQTNRTCPLIICSTMSLVEVILFLTKMLLFPLCLASLLLLTWIHKTPQCLFLTLVHFSMYVSFLLLKDDRTTSSSFMVRTGHCLFTPPSMTSMVCLPILLQTPAISHTMIFWILSSVN